MQNIKYHIFSSLSVLLFSYIAATTINIFVKHEFAVSENFKISGKNKKNIFSKNVIDYQKILDSNFFLKGEEIAADVGGITEEAPPPPSAIADLKLMGTITGPSSIAVAIIQKRGQKETESFKLWKDVHGYKLVKIRDYSVDLQGSGKQNFTIEMYEKKKVSSSSGNSTRNNSRGSASSVVKKTISRSTLKESLSNLDSALKGLKAGPYRENGQVAGFKLIRIRSNNILYKLGARSGDIIKRINGHPVDGTAKLLQMWQNFPQESRIKVDFKRGNDIVSYDFKISD